MIETKKVFITVKTYPTLSKKYDELVCTAGFFEDGSWVHIYPFPFRKLDYDKRYRKYQWMELQLERNFSDPRPETYKVVGLENINLIGDPVSTGKRKDWKKRKEIIFSKSRIYTDLTELITLAKANELSLATFKPKEIIAFEVEKTEREWPAEKLALLEAKSKQLSLFQTKEELKKEFSVVKKLPYKFFYRFRDEEDRESRLMIEDWEIGALYWNCLRDAQGNEESALKKVREMYEDSFLKKDIHLFLGTIRTAHFRFPNPFVIIGVFYPPKNPQLSLF